MSILIIAVGTVAILVLFGSVREYYRMKKIAKSRGEPDICSYARSFDYRKVDTEIMREVFVSLQDWTGKYNGIDFPVKAEDSFDSIYEMDREDLSYLCVTIAEKLKINLDDVQNNPYWSELNTVKDLVIFFDYQKHA
jgi:hypothetical protein